MKQLRISIIASLVAAGFSAGAIAADNEQVKVTASVTPNCQVVSHQDINFGALDPAQAIDVKAAGALTFACTKSVNYTLTADKGMNASGDKRRMKGSEENFLAYALAQDSFTGKGQGFSTPITVALNATVAGVDYKDLPAESYADVLRVTVMP